MMASRVFVLLAVLYALASFDFESPALVGVCISVLRESTSLASGVEGSNTHSTLELLDDDRFIKPVTSENLYRYIKLRNELDVFLVSQSDAKESSARIGVKAGYLKDPDSLPGLAHYLEHLLFINTEKYPELDGFGKFVTLHNGYTNAYTSDTETVYEFNTDSSSFEEALSMFSEFFKSPLFDSTYTEKELMAIENEFNYRKNFQFIRSIHVVLENSDAKSLFRRFCIGNIETLRTIPESQGINVRDEVIGLFNREYSSNRMVLVLASSHTLEELASFAIQYFSDIPNKRLPVHSIYQPIQDGNLNPYRKMIKQLVLIDSLDKFTTMKLVFPMKRYMAKHLSQYRSLYLEKFISSTRPGSLSNHLLFSKLIFDSYARIEDNNLGFTNLEIGFTLTAVGERNIPNILISLFSVFKFMSVKKLPKEVYDERKRISDYSFRYGDSVSSVKESEHIISNFLEYGCKPEEVLYFDSYLSEFDPEIHQEIISQLVPENLIVFLEHFELESLIQSTDVSKFNYFCNSTSVNEIENVDYSRSDQGFESIIDSSIAMQDIKTERFIKVKYVTKPLSPCFLSLLNNADHNMASERYGITLPRLNPYLSTDFSNNLKCVDEEKVPTRLPAAIRKFLSGGCGGPSDHRTENPEAYGRYFYYPTKSINTPKSSLQIAFIFPLDLVSKGFSEFPTNTGLDVLAGPHEDEPAHIHPVRVHGPHRGDCLQCPTVHEQLCQHGYLGGLRLQERADHDEHQEFNRKSADLHQPLADEDQALLQPGLLLRGHASPARRHHVRGVHPVHQLLHEALQTRGIPPREPKPPAVGKDHPQVLLGVLCHQACPPRPSPRLVLADRRQLLLQIQVPPLAHDRPPPRQKERRDPGPAPGPPASEALATHSWPPRAPRSTTTTSPPPKATLTVPSR
ncbi:peptidase'insulinase-like peptidase' [Cryptosporidium canis]|nr:peptidase'insulinase-like peptidase' [Cryptosporidium canis]